ncbi:ATP-binding protein [uncultured Flavobacterium sp.]|uniref:ATP-binding protein n=1 Tax=uncultured Flavobacterium sp. TaxID=165435 RepID=UPI002639859C|nr:ATP-binding protein [uncultured Flavobacterium sp.]
MAKVRFRTNILLKSIIGKDLITDDNVAVLELVKNCFDSGSNNAKIIFRDIISNLSLRDYKKSNSSKIIIRDTGSGMSEYDLINKWLNIAYSEKKTKKEEFNRQLAGNKGVGRFSCDRLGKSLTIYTRKKNEPLLKLYIDWTEFEKVNDIERNIQDIDFELDEISTEQYIQETELEKFSTGTTLFISDLREVWDLQKIQSLKRQLERFINPNQNFEAESFDVLIQADEYKKLELSLPDSEKINGLVKNRIFSNLDFKATYINSKISNDGKILTTVLRDRGKEIFTLVENNPYDLLKDIEINIYYLNPYSKAYFKRQTGIRSKEFGSIFLFVNGFRIPPYGDDGNDWLGMEMRKSQGYNRFLGTREVIGRIEINGVEFDDDKDDFFIISNRSGVDNNKHFEQLTKNDTPYGYYFKTFRRLERFVVEGIHWDSSNLKDNAIEKKVLEDKNWNESKEEYKEDSLTRNKRVISLIDKIINSKSEDVISLSINKKLVTELAEEQAQKAKAEIDSIVGQLNNKTLSSNQIYQLINELSKSEIEIENFPVNEKLIQDLKLEQEKLKLELQAKFEQTKELEEEAKRLEEKNKRLEEELELEKEKNTYLRTSSRTLTEDAKGLVHNIKITSKKISSSVDNLYDKILNNDYTKNSLLKSLGAIKFQSEKANKISKIITRSNFKTDSNAQIADVVKYIEQYIEIYSDIYPRSELEFKINNSSASLVKKFSVLDMSVVLDDLISNSEKAGANLIEIEMSNSSEGVLEILFSDNGIGIAEQFLKDEKSKEKIFDLGITTTKGGSGIGMNSVREGLKSMNGTIKLLGNNLKLNGACFEIQIK